MFIKGIGTAVPKHRYSQGQCFEALKASGRYETLAPRSRAILRKVLTNDNGIETRHLALEDLAQAFDLSPDVLHKRFENTAPRLAAEAGRKACEQAQVGIEEVDGILVSTCTGYLCPGLTSYVSEILGLRRSAPGLDLVGQGCVAALPNLMTANTMVQSGRANILSICVEVCSAAFYLDDDVGVLISACLFGDGAAAAIIGRDPGRNRRIRIKHGASVLVPEDRKLLRFEQSAGMLRNVLSPRVPEVAAQHARSLLDVVLADTFVEKSQIQGWILHPGGRDVLDALQAKLELGARDVRASRSVLRRFGNLSSPSVYFVLDEALSDSVPGGYWWMSSFGAGFSCQGALLEVE